MLASAEEPEIRGEEQTDDDAREQPAEEYDGDVAGRVAPEPLPPVRRSHPLVRGGRRVGYEPRHSRRANLAFIATAMIMMAPTKTSK